MRIFAARIAHFPRRSMGLFDAWNDLPPDRTPFVRRINQVEEIRRDGQRQLRVGELAAGEFLRRERGHQLLQLFDGGDAMFELPAPVVPVGVSHFRPKAASGRFEFFQRTELTTRGWLVATAC